MPSFAELRAKAEAAANSAKSTANSKLAAYRGDEQQQQPAKPVYNPPRPRPTVKPDIPQATRPPAPDHEQADTQADDTTALVESDLSPEIQTLINNKALFFEFLDEYFANHGYKSHEDVGLDTPTKIEPQENEEEPEAGPELHPPEPSSQDIARIEEPIRQDDTVPPPLPPSRPRQRHRPPVPRSSLPPTPSAHDRKVSESQAPDPPPQVPAPGRVSLPRNPPAPIIATAPNPIPPTAITAPQDMYSSRKERPLSAAPSTDPLPTPSTETEVKGIKGGRFSKLMKMATTLSGSGSTPSTSTATATATAPLPPPSSLPPPVPTTKPRSVSETSLLSSSTPGVPPPTFSSDASGGEFEYMPKTGRKAAESECSAARFVQYFHHNVTWDLWYTAEGANARPPSLVGTIEVRWRGSVVGSQETKRRLFLEKTSAMEWVRVGYVLFQDHSMAWYRVMWKENDPIGSLQREVRWRPQPTPWNGERLYAAHAHYGQAIAEFCEQAVRMGQFVDRGEPWDMANGAIQALAKHNPNAPSVVPSIGHCHGHLIYEGFVGEGGGWGSTRGGDSAVRAGDILEWCNAELQATDTIGNTFTLRIGVSGFVSVIASAFEFPDRLDEDQHTLPPYRLPPVDIIEQSARSGMAPSKRTVSFETMTKGRIWVFRPVPWDYLGFQAEPRAEWPPPEPTRQIDRNLLPPATMPNVSRPPFEYQNCTGRMKDEYRSFIPVVTCKAEFPVELLEHVLYEFIHNPELTSQLILRTEIQSDDSPTTPSHDEDSLGDKKDDERLRGYTLVRQMRRKLLPRRPDRDLALLQDCLLYREEESLDISLLVLKPLLSPGQTIPHYHPDVRSLAIRYREGSPAPGGALTVEVTPNKEVPEGGSRLYNTCVVLLHTVWKHCWGAWTGYKKRVVHDAVVDRATYQDLYWVMRERYKGLVLQWAESTDPVKNVFEDIAIATFLILLWRDTYKSKGNAGERSQPPGGFVDMGCGAGLLVHILLSEGYTGIGIDVRQRISWSRYPGSTRSNLLVHAFDPTIDDFPPAIFKEGAFLIGNHADELTPWLPVLASLIPGTTYLSIPCCQWSLDQKFHRNDANLFPKLKTAPSEELEGRLGETRKSAYGSYLCWLLRLGSECGFVGEVEALRLPSTRNYAIIGRKRDPVFDTVGKDAAVSLLDEVRRRGMFKTRPPGAGGEH